MGMGCGGADDGLQIKRVDRTLFILIVYSLPIQQIHDLPNYNVELAQDARASHQGALPMVQNYV